MVVNELWKWTLAGLAALLVLPAGSSDAATQKRRVIQIEPGQQEHQVIVLHADDNKKQRRHAIQISPHTRAHHVTVFRKNEDDKKQHRRILRFAPDSEVVFQQTSPSDYWIGVGCGDVSEALRAQLGIDDDLGLLVQNVIDDGPAEKAGIEVHDVLIRAADHSLKGIKDLSDAVNEAEEGELEIELIRGGDVVTIQVAPEKRKSHFEFRTLEPDMERTQKWLERFGSGHPTRFNLNFRRPGQAFELDFPDDLNIRINKSGGDPAEIIVEQGDQTWEVSEDSLDELPDEVRKYVDSVLGRTPGPTYSWFQPGGAQRSFDFIAPQREREEGEEGSGQRSLESLFERLEKQLNERMEKLQERLEDLQKRMPAEPDGGVNAA